MTKLITSAALGLLLLLGLAGGFLHPGSGQAVAAATGEKTIRERKSGEVLWHSKGEDAPVLTNLGSKPYRTLVVELL